MPPLVPEPIRRAGRSRCCYEREHLPATQFDVLCCRWHSFAFRRITSYNVCYTKLLRADILCFNFLAVPQHRHPVCNFKNLMKMMRNIYDRHTLLLYLTRITSYNVCYTKLLRPFLINQLANYEDQSSRLRCRRRISTVEL